MEKTEKSIRRIGIYFLVLGVISALYGLAFQTGIVIPICIILMCIPRLVYNKKWAGVSLMISSILMTLALFYFLGIDFGKLEGFNTLPGNIATSVYPNYGKLNGAIIITTENSKLKKKKEE